MTQNQLGTDELESYLSALAREGDFRVDRVLKESPFETTEIVSFVGAGGSAMGPFVRKRIARDAGLGSAYEDIFAAQRVGRRFLHIPTVHECYRTDEDLVVIMEYVPGCTLDTVVSSCKDADARLATARDLFPALCEAVTELHEGMRRPVVHRDLKPENVVVTNAGSVVLIDFGIARTFREGGARDTHRFGTCSYAPPEQFGFGQTDVRSDVYALGLVLWFCLAGHVPGPGDRERGFALDGVAEPLRKVVARAAAFDPAARYESARELGAAFATAVGEACGISAAASHVSPPSSPAVRALGRPSLDSAGTPSLVQSNHPRLTLLERFRGWRASLPRWASIAWNVVLAIYAVLVVAACVSLTFDPSGRAVSDPLWYRFFEYMIFGMVLFLSPAYLLADKGWLRRHVSWFARRNSSDDVVLCEGLLVAGTVLLWVLGLPSR